MQVDGDEVDGCADTALAQFADELVAVDAKPIELQPDRVEVPGVLDIVAYERPRDLGQAGEEGVIAAGDLGAALLERRELADLVDTDRSLNIRHRVVEAGGQDLVLGAALFRVAIPRVLTEPVEAEQPHSVG